VLILPVGFVRRDEDVHWYAAPLALIGALISFYHYLLQMGIIPEKLAPCVAGVSCLTKYFTLAGFITLPLLSFIAFIIILLLLLAYARTRPKFI
jgi:disulfide bond formation protein DsbB